MERNGERLLEEAGQLTAEDDELAGVLDAYLAEVEAGKTADLDRLLSEHPTIVGRLRACLASLQVVEQAVSGLSSLAVPPEDGPLEVGRLGDYRILREIGRGGMGIVYEAEQISLGRRVALKVLPFAVTVDPRRLQRFKHEAQAAAHLHHTHIVPVFSVGCERGVHYYAMQYIEGQTLATLIRELHRLAGLKGESGERETGTWERNGEPVGQDQPTVPCAVVPALGAGCAPGANTQPEVPVWTERSAASPAFFRTVAQLGVQAAEALEHAHEMGVIHRDIKPANLLVDSAAHLWITDFGLAQFRNDLGLTATGDLLGTIRYMSPEQALAKRGAIDHRTDIYSLGATLYELLALEPVFPGCNRGELLRQIAFDEPHPPRQLNRAIPCDLETIVLKSLAKNPQDRYASAQDLADDLRRFLERKTIQARRPNFLERAGRWARAHRAMVGSAIGVLLLTAVGLAISTLLIAQEQAHTQAAYSAEAQQRARVEKSFHQAREALDAFAQVSEEELADKPELQAVRRKLLEVALKYYQDFIDDSGDDPSIRAELAASHLRVATILNEIGTQADALAAIEKAQQFQAKLGREQPSVPGFQQALSFLFANLDVLRTGGQLRWLAQKPIQEDLKLSSEQGKQIAQIQDKRRELARMLHSPKPEDWQRNFEEFAAQEQALTGILLPQQSRRLQQIILQERGIQALGDTDIAETLQLNEDQKTRLRAILDDAARRAPESSFLPGPPRPELWMKMEERARASREDILNVLTADQKTAWKEMTGEPFAGDLRPGYFRGPPPRPPDHRRRNTP